MNKRIRAVIILVFGITATLITTFVISETKIVSQIGNCKIYQREVTRELSRLIEGVSDSNPDMTQEELDTYKQSVYPSVLADLENRKIMDQKLNDLGLLSNEEINTKLNKTIEMIRNQFENEEYFRIYLKNLKMTTREYIEFQRRTIKEAALYNHIFKDIEITDTEITEYYNNHKDEYRIYPSAVIHEIVVDSKDLADSAFDELSQGNSFEKVFSNYNTDTSLNKTNGYVGFFEFKDNTTIKESEEVTTKVKNLLDNEFTEPIKIDEKYHIFKASDVCNELKNLTKEEAASDIKLLLLSEKQEKVLKANLEVWREELKN